MSGWSQLAPHTYGTAYWQVGDSKEQNGSFKMALAKAKKHLLAIKMQHCMKRTIEPHDIMVILSDAWDSSFSRVNKNNNAISDRGWNPLNYQLLMNPDIRATMTPTEVAFEKQ